jgi:ankyrin repeat protein
MAETTYVGIAATGDSRQHNGNVTNSTHGIAHPIRTALIKTLDYRYQYSLRMRRSDETMRDDQRNHLLLRAAAEGQLPRIQHLIRLGSDIDFSDDAGSTALHHAVLSGFEDCVQESIKQGSDVNATALYGTSLNLAAQKERLHVALILLRARADQQRALALAAKHGQDVHSLRCFLDSDSSNSVTPIRNLEDISEEMVPQLRRGLTLHEDLDRTKLELSAELDRIDVERKVIPESKTETTISTSHDEDHTIAQGESTCHPEHIDGLDSSILEPKPHSTTSLALPAAVDTGPAQVATQLTTDYDEHSYISKWEREEKRSKELSPTALVIKNIPFAVKKQQLVTIMVEMGLPLPYAFHYHFDDGVFRGKAFANFINADDAATVLDAMEHFELNGRKLKVDYRTMGILDPTRPMEYENRQHDMLGTLHHIPLPGEHRSIRWQRRFESL